MFAVVTTICCRNPKVPLVVVTKTTIPPRMFAVITTICCRNPKVPLVVATRTTTQANKNVVMAIQLDITWLRQPRIVITDINVLFFLFSPIVPNFWQLILHYTIKVDYVVITYNVKIYNTSRFCTHT
jgi:hypothetical protein